MSLHSLSSESQNVKIGLFVLQGFYAVSINVAKARSILPNFGQGIVFQITAVHVHARPLRGHSHPSPLGAACCPCMHATRKLQMSTFVEGVCITLCLLHTVVVV